MKFRELPKVLSLSGNGNPNGVIKATVGSTYEDSQDPRLPIYINMDGNMKWGIFPDKYIIKWKSKQ